MQVVNFRSDVEGVRWPALPQGRAPGLLSLLFQFEQTQWWPAARRRERELSQLGALLDHAAKSTSFYRERLAALGWRQGQALTDKLWNQLPCVRRSDLSTHVERFYSVPVPHHGRMFLKKTSGSTGSPLEIRESDVTSLFWSAMTLRDHLWQRRDFSGSLVTIRSGRDATDPFAVQRRPSWGPPAAEVFETGPMTLFYHRLPVEQQAEVVRDCNPHFLLAYPTNVLELADYYQYAGLELPRLTEVRTYGEAVNADVRAAVRETWGAAVHDVYSCEELGYIALQCHANDHYHVMAEDVLVEILDHTGSPCAPGQVGRVVLTDLHNFVMPLIRYENGDYAEAGEGCDCGRTLPVINRVIGRKRNLARLPDNRCFEARVPRALWRKFSGIDRLQLVQDDVRRITIRIAVKAPLDAATKQALQSDVAAALKFPFDFSIEERPEIPRHDNGKFESFMSTLDWDEQHPPEFVV